MLMLMEIIHWEENIDEVGDSSNNVWTMSLSVREGTGLDRGWPGKRTQIVLP